MTFYDKIAALCLERGISITALATTLGYSQSAATTWKNSKGLPRANTIKKMAEYFNVPIAYFTGEADIPVQGETVPLEQENLRMIPLFESVAAGFSAYASEEIQDYMPVYFHNISDAAETICIKVKGDSMYPKIEDGDIIQVHKQDAVDNGSIAVVLLDGNDGLVKKVCFSSSGIELQSLNPTYKTMHFDGAEAARIRVVGIVTQVIKGINGRKVPSVRMGDNKKELLDSIDKMDAKQLQEFNNLFNEYLRSKEQK